MPTLYLEQRVCHAATDVGHVLELEAAVGAVALPVGGHLGLDVHQLLDGVEALDLLALQLVQLTAHAVTHELQVLRDVAALWGEARGDSYCIEHCYK